MPFPKIDVCIVCEGVRPEQHNKNLLLGYFGITPYVTVVYPNVQNPAVLFFVFSGGGGTPANYDLKLSLIDPNGVELSTPQTSPPIKAGALGAAPVSNVFFGFHGVLGRAGRFRVGLIVDGVIHFESTVDIKQVPPQGQFLN
jgi:hypothetical protein